MEPVQTHSSALESPVILASVTTFSRTQGAVDAKTGELAESAHRNVQLGARVRSARPLYS